MCTQTLSGASNANTLMNIQVRFEIERMRQKEQKTGGKREGGDRETEGLQWRESKGGPLQAEQIEQDGLRE